MKTVNKLVTLAAAGLLGALVAARAGAQMQRPESTLTITERTEVPGGVILEPGTYAVKVADVQSSWNVVKITNADETKTLATVLTTPHTASDSSAHTLFVFYNAPEGAPKALRSWWPPNDRFGQDFVYGKERAEELARLSNEHVPEMTPQMETSVAEKPEPKPEETTALNTPPASAPETGSTWKTEKIETTTATEPQQTTTAENTAAPRSELPKTASPYPLLALAGSAFLALGFGLKRLLV